MENDPEPRNRKPPICAMLSILAAAFAFLATRSSNGDLGSGIIAALIFLGALIGGVVTGFIGLARGESPTIFPVIALLLNLAVFLLLRK